MPKEKEAVFRRIYPAAFLLLTALFIFEVPRIVFWAPLLLFALFLVKSILFKEKLHFPVIAVVLAVYTVVFIVFKYDPSESVYYQSYIHIQGVMMFLIGYHFFSVAAPAAERRTALDRYLLAVAAMYVLYAIITFIHHYYFTPADLEDRFYYSIWYDYITKPATVISLSLVIPLCWGVYSLFFSPLRYKLVGAFFIAFTIGVNLYTGTRTLVYLTPVLLIAECFVWLTFKKKKYKLGISLTVAAVAAVAALLLAVTVFKDALLERFGNTPISRFLTMGFSSKLRWRYTKNVLDDFSFTYLGGGIHSKTFGTPHNIWLYIYDYGGIVSFLIYCVFTVLLLIRFVRFLINKTVSTELRFMIATLFGAIMVEYMLEPFMEPLPSFYILTLFIFGVFCGLAGKKKDPEAQLSQPA